MHFLFGLLVLTQFALAKRVDHIVAIVNDQIVTLSDSNTFIKAVNNGGMIDDALIQMFDPKKLATDRDQALQFLIDERLLDSEIKHKSLEVTLERVEAEIRDLMAKRGINRDQLKEVLKGRNVNMAQYQDYIKSSLERHALIEKEVSSKIRITDEDVASYYASHNKTGGKGEVFEYSIAHILVVPKKGEEEKAKKKIAEAYDKLESGQAFDATAEQFSEDPTFSKGGMLGNFTSSEMQPEIERAVRPLQVGEISGITRTKSGYNIFKVVKKTLVSDPELEAKREDIRNTLFGEAFKRQFRAWINERREAAFIKINGWA